MVDTVRFTGDPLFSPEEGVDLAELEPGMVFTPEKAQVAAQRLIRAAVARRYPLAQVAWRAEQTADGDFSVVFEVEAGPRGFLKELRFTGHQVFTEEELASVLQVQPSTRWDRLWRRPALQVEELARDREELLGLYQQHGHMEAEVRGAELEWVPRLDGFRITWPILREGPVYSTGYVRFDADHLPSPDDLEALIPLRAGTPFNPQAVRIGAERLQRYLYLQGHAFAEVAYDVELDAAEARADVLFRVEAGVEQTVRGLTIQGHDRTRERIIRRELALAPGDVFDPVSLEWTQARLTALPMFAEAAVYYHGTRDEHDLDIVVDVEERRTGRVEAGFIYGEVEGGAFQLNVSEHNLALTPPFRGAALVGQLGLTAGPRIRRFDLRLLNPRMGYSEFSLDGSAFYEDNEFASTLYNQRSMGGTVLLGHPIGMYQLLSSGFAANVYEIYDIEPVLAEQLDPDENDFRLVSWVLAWSLDRRDRDFRPTRGFRLSSDLRIGNELLGGDTDVMQWTTEGVGFLNPWGDHVISLRANWRSVDAYGVTEDVPIPLRLLLGGAHNLRGFDYRSVGPRDDEDRLMGGGSAWWASLEYLFPLGQRFDLAAYVDTGDVAEDAFRLSGDGPVANWGLGILVRADNFPVRFDIAFPITIHPDDLVNEVGHPRISFSAGYRY